MNQNADAGVGDTPATFKSEISDKYRAPCQRIDIKEVATAALDQVKNVLSHYLPGGNFKGNEYVVPNPTRNDANSGSFCINRTTGVWKDFATNDGGGDLVSLVAYVRSIDQLPAAKLVADYLGLYKFGDTGDTGDTKSQSLSLAPVAESKFVTPDSDFRVTGDTEQHAEYWQAIPANAPLPPSSHFEYGAPAAKYGYVNSDGALVGFQCRFNTSAGKTFLPSTFDHEREVWQWKGQQGWRPMYNRDQIEQRKDAPILLVEGEGKADKAASMLEELVVTTTMNGSQSPKKTDWRAIEERNLIIWRDNDAAGLKYQNACIELATKHGAKSIKVVQVENIRVNGEPLRPKFDLGDVDEIGWTSAEIRRILDDPRITQLKCLVEPEKKGKPALIKWPASNIGERFELNKRGVHFVHEPDPKEPTKPPRRQWICDHLRVLAAVRNSDGKNWGRRLEFTAPDGKLQQWCMPMEMLKGSGEEYRGVLLSLGLGIAPGSTARGLLNTYIHSATPDVIAKCTDKTGWHGTRYVLPDRTIGTSSDGEDLYFQTDSECRSLEQKGTIEQWQENVARLCIGNSRLMFAVCVSFAGPLLHLVDEEGGGFHLRGGSSIGKSTTLFIAASVFSSGAFVGSWRATDNGLEGIALAHNDMVLLLDEMGQVDPHKLGEIAYLLANGQGKTRAGRSGNARNSARFRVVFLSTGEIALSDHMSGVGRRTNAGQETRIVDISADAGCGFGLFENLHGAADGDVFARKVKSEAEKYYGTPIIAFIQELAGGDSNLPTIIRGMRDSFVKTYLNEPASGQASRVAGRFGMMAAAGELATHYGITGWQKGDAEQAVAKCFSTWIDTRGGAGAIEPQAMLDQVRLFFQQHGESRFTLWKASHSESDRTTINRAGFKKLNDSGTKTEFYVFQEVFKKEICTGLDAKHVAKVLVDKGWLLRDNDGKSTRSARLPEIGLTRCFVFTANVLSDGG